MVADKRALVRQSREMLGDARGPEATALRAKLDALGGTYDRFAELFEMLPAMDGPLDLEAIIDGLPAGASTRSPPSCARALGMRRPARASSAQFAVISTRSSLRPMNR